MLTFKTYYSFTSNLFLFSEIGTVLSETGQTPTTKRALRRIKQLATLTPQRMSSRLAPPNHGIGLMCE